MKYKKGLRHSAESLIRHTFLGRQFNSWSITAGGMAEEGAGRERWDLLSSAPPDTESCVRSHGPTRDSLILCWLKSNSPEQYKKAWISQPKSMCHSLMAPPAQYPKLNHYCYAFRSPRLHGTSSNLTGLFCVAHAMPVPPQQKHLKPSRDDTMKP